MLKRTDTHTQTPIRCILIIIEALSLWS
jgi:hypothetical protein